MDCTAPRHDNTPAEAMTHARLCRPCKTGLSRHLRRLPALHDLLDITPARNGGRHRGRGDGLPYSDPASECRSQIHHDLTWWTKHLADGRECERPAATITAMCGWLHGQLGGGGRSGILYRDDAGDLAAAISHDYSRALAILDPWPVKKFPANARCPDCGTGDLICNVYSEADKRRPVVACDACDAEWTAEQWIRLGQRIITARAAA